MLQVNVLRTKTDWVKERLAIRNFKQPELVDAIIALDDERKKLQAAFDLSQSKINSASKDIGKLMAQGDKAGAEALKAEVAVNKTEVASLTASMTEVEKKLQETLVQLPNLPNEQVPAGKTPEDNEVVREGGVKPTLYAGAKPHWDLIKELKLVD